MDRFDSKTGQYGKWLRTGEMTDYMVLDLRHKKSATIPPGMDMSKRFHHFRLSVIGLMNVRRLGPVKTLADRNRQRLEHRDNFFWE
jgi:hypothetical protein